MLKIIMKKWRNEDLKKYISEEAQEVYYKCGRRKMIIAAPTGAGKTTFLLKTVIPYVQKMKRKSFRPEKKS